MADKEKREKAIHNKVMELVKDPLFATLPAASIVEVATTLVDTYKKGYDNGHSVGYKEGYADNTYL